MNRNLLDQQIPKSILSIGRQTTIVLAMAISAVAFIIIFRPFRIFESLDFMINTTNLRFINSSEDAFYLALASVVLVGFLVVLCSRILLIKKMNKELTYRVFIWWFGVEFIMAAIGITICSATLFHPDNSSLLKLFIKVLGRTTCILFLPYLICCMYIIILDKASQVRALRESLENDTSEQQKAYTLFYDDHNEMRLSVKREDLVMIESADNYICVWYLNNGQIKKSLIRNTMKRVTEQMKGSSIQRCHRSYMINMDRVKVLRRDKDGVFIELGIDGVADVPISRTYMNNITEWLMK